MKLEKLTCDMVRFYCMVEKGEKLDRDIDEILQRYIRNNVEGDLDDEVFAKDYTEERKAEWDKLHQRWLKANGNEVFVQKPEQNIHEMATNMINEKIAANPDGFVLP